MQDLRLVPVAPAQWAVSVVREAEQVPQVDVDRVVWILDKNIQMQADAGHFSDLIKNQH